MAILGVLYGTGLTMIGLDVGILIGLVAGVLTFVPYLGPATVIILGGMTALIEYGDWQHFAGVLAVFGVGQLIESLWLTPKLVGDRIGLHPAAVIFAGARRRAAFRVSRHAPGAAGRGDHQRGAALRASSVTPTAGCMRASTA